tara:strand:- start:25991 stop:26110 length:120 start_codon:yes stop_codon:yes gene_type:complete
MKRYTKAGEHVTRGAIKAVKDEASETIMGAIKRFKKDKK